MFATNVENPIRNIAVVASGRGLAGYHIDDGVSSLVGTPTRPRFQCYPGRVTIQAVGDSQ
jgi:hypothetical protein